MGWFRTLGGRGGLGLVLFGCIVSASCGAREADSGAPAQQQPVASSDITEDSDWWVAGAEPAKNLVLLAVDGLRLGAWSGEDLPNLATLVQQGRAFPHHVVDSMGSQAQLASLLSGLPAEQHGVGSVHERGRSFLGEDLAWWPATLKTRGWRTLASLATPQYGPAMGGMQRGFDVFLEPALVPGSFRSAEQVTFVGLEAWTAALSGSDPFLALWHFADFQHPGILPSARVREQAEQCLRGWVQRYPQLAQAAHEVGRSAESFEDVRRALGRSRGSEVLQSFHTAIYRGQLADLDAVVGRLVSDLDRAGRLDDTAIALVSLRGSFVGAPPTDGPAFAPEIARAPAVLWSPGRIAPGRHAGLVPTHELGRRLAWLLGFEAAPDSGLQPKDHEASTVWAADYSRRASFGKHVHREENAAAGWVTVDREGRSILQVDALSADAQADEQRVRVHADRPTALWGLRLDFDLPAGEEVTLRWRLLAGRTRAVEPSSSDAVQDLFVRRQSGRARLQGQGHLFWQTTQREVPFVLEWEAPEPLCSPSPDPRLWVVPREPQTQQDPRNGSASAARILRDAGLWTRLIVGGEPGRPVEVWTALVPTTATTTPNEPTLEITTDASHQVESPPGRRDALRLQASTPINSQFQEGPAYHLAMAIQVGGRWLLPHEVSVPGVEAIPPSAALYVPDWWPGVTESLAEGWTLRPGMTLRRFGAPQTMRRAWSESAREYVQTMGQGE